MNSPVHQRIAGALARLAALSRAKEQGQAQASGLSPLQGRVLVALARRPRLRVGQLAQELMVTYGTVSAAITSLVEKGLAQKSADPEEHRAVRVVLTRRGRAAARRAEDHGAEQLEPAVAELPGADSATLLAALLKLIRAFERRGEIAQSRMCLTCRYFRPHAGEGTRPHYCDLLEEPIGPAELQIDCPDHDPASPSRAEQVWREITSAS